MAQKRRVTFIGGPFNGLQKTLDDRDPDPHTARCFDSLNINRARYPGDPVACEEVEYRIRQVDTYEYIGLLR